MKNKGFTLVEVCVAVVLLSLLSGILFMMFTNQTRQSQIQDDRLHFFNSTQLFFEILKNDLRSLKKINVDSSMIEIEKVKGLNNEGDEVLEVVSYVFSAGRIGEMRGEKKHTYLFLNENMKKLGSTLDCSFNLGNKRNSNDYISAIFSIQMIVSEKSGKPLPGFNASMTMDILWKNDQNN